MTLTTEQQLRINAIVDSWNEVRRDAQRRATASEVIDFMLGVEEESITAMHANDVLEVAAELAREDLADEKPLPPMRRASAELLSDTNCHKGTVQ